MFECINAQMDARSYCKFKLVFKDEEQRGSEGFTSGFLSQTMSFFYQLVEILPQCLSLMEPFSAQAEKAEYEVVHLFFLCGICLPSVELQRRFVSFIIAVVMASLGLKAITTAGPSRTKHSQIIFLKVNDRIYIYGQHTQNNGKQSNTIQAAVLTVIVKVL